jgi:hypothetical protein
MLCSMPPIFRRLFYGSLFQLIWPGPRVTGSSPTQMHPVTYRGSTVHSRSDVPFRRTIRQTIFLVGIPLLPMLIQRICDLGKPCTVFDLFQHFRRRKILDAGRHWIAQRLQQTRRDKHQHNLRLTVRNQSHRVRSQPGRSQGWGSSFRKFALVTQRSAQEALGHDSKPVHRAYANGRR